MLRKYKKMFTLSDTVLIIVIIVVAVTVFFYQRQSSSLTIRVTYKDKTVAEFSGMAKESFVLPDGHGIIEVDRGKARIIHSDCHLHICEKQGWTSSLPIVCAPNRVLVEFIRAKKEDDIIILH